MARAKKLQQTAASSRTIDSFFKKPLPNGQPTAAKASKPSPHPSSATPNSSSGRVNDANNGLSYSNMSLDRSDTRPRAESDSPSSSDVASKKRKPFESSAASYSANGSEPHLESISACPVSPMPHTRKKRRISPPVDDQVIPGSQSSEEELALSKHSSPSVGSSSIPPSPRSISYPAVNILSAEGSRRQSTPPPQMLAAVPASPLLLTPKSKTQAIIDRIRAKSIAAAAIKEEAEPRVFETKLDSDSDEDLAPLFPVLKKVNPPPKQASLPDRRRSVTPASSTKHLTSKVAAAKTKQTSFALDLLLKEKEQAERSGKDEKAILRAQRIAEQFQNGTIDDDEPINFMDEEAARNAVFNSQLSSPSFGPDTFVGEADTARLLGDKNGRAVAKILRSRNVASVKPPGIPLWEVVSSDANSIFEEIKPNPLPIPSDSSSGNKLVQLLYGALRENDLARATIILYSGVLTRLQPANEGLFFSFLQDLAFSAPSDLATAAFTCLMHILRTTATAPVIGPGMIVTVLKRLGAATHALDEAGYQPGIDVEVDQLMVNHREEVLHRLVVASCQSCSQTSETPAIILLLLLIGCYPKAPESIANDVTLAIDSLCDSLSEDDSVITEVERQIALSTFSYLQRQDPQNKLLLFSFFLGGSCRAERIARWMAHGTITGSTDICTYTDLPSLDLLEASISPASDVSQQLHGLRIQEDTDYVTFGIYAKILGIALTNIWGYTIQEKTTKTVPQSPSQSKEKPKTMLQSIQVELDELHSRINDRCAADLERSRAKAIIKSITLRVHYQRQSTRAVGTKPNNLDAWLKRKQSSRN